MIREQGEKLAHCTTGYFVERVRQARLNESLLALIEPLLKTLETVDDQLTGVEAELGRLCAAEPIIQQLCTAPGVGPIVAAGRLNLRPDESHAARRKSFAST